MNRRHSLGQTAGDVTVGTFKRSHSKLGPGHEQCPCAVCGCCCIGRMGTCVGGCGPRGGRSKHDRAAQTLPASQQRHQRPVEALQDTSGVPEASTGVQWIVLNDFPDTLTARVLSPNGRAHWGAKQRATENVYRHVWLALRECQPLPVQPPATVLYRWVMPDHRKRDLDNHGTGVVKAIQDCLVARGILPGGDHSEALTSRVEIVVQKYRRAIEIRLTPADWVPRSGEV